MEETLFDSQGTAIVRFNHNDDTTIYLWDGTLVAYLSNNNIYGFNDIHLGKE